MPPGDAERLGIRNGDEVQVAVTGGSRDLVFRQVQVRVDPDSRLEMHIGVDETSAAGFPVPADTCRRFAGDAGITAEILGPAVRAS